MTKTDSQLKKDVEDELAADPTVHADQINVTVDNGAVSLSGNVPTYPEKFAAQDATKRVSSAYPVARDLTVVLRPEHMRGDADVGAAVYDALRWNVQIPSSVTAKVDRGHVTLEGHVAWHFQRKAARRAVKHLTGVVAVHNEIVLSPYPFATEQVRDKIQTALRRQANADARSIHIEVAGGKVTLTGHASSWQTIEDAANAAWAVPGVTEVIDQVQRRMTF